MPTGPVLHEAVVMGKQYTAEEALGKGIISLACDNSQLLSNALSLANKITKRGPYNRQNLQNMKTLMYKELVDSMERQRKMREPSGLLGRL